MILAAGANSSLSKATVMEFCRHRLGQLARSSSLDKA
jgi:hypothetical protein